jgi:hypothetical protein
MHARLFRVSSDIHLMKFSTSPQPENVMIASNPIKVYVRED